MLYLISDNSRLKIGWSKHPERRLKQLQTGSGSTLKIVFKADVPKYMEKRVHHILRRFKTRPRNEWFELSGIEIDELVDKILPQIISS